MSRLTCRLAGLALASLVSSFFGPSPDAQVCASAGADMVGWWDGDQVEPGSAGDLLGERPLLGSSVSTVPFLVGDALRFDDTPADSLTLGAPLLDTTGPFALECWMRLDPSATGLNTIVAEVGTESSTNEGQFALRVLSDQRIQFLRKTGSGESVRLVNSPISIPPGVPVHVVAMFGQDSLNDDNLELWINGQRFHDSNTSVFTTGFPHEFRVGSTSGSSSTFHGEIDELIAYDRALSDGEILDSFLAGPNGRCKTCAPILGSVQHHWTADSLCDGYALDEEGGVALAPVGTGARFEGMDGQAFLASVTTHFTAGGQIAPANGPFAATAWVQPESLTGNTGILSEFGTGAPLEGQWALRRLAGGSLQFWRMNAGTACPGGGSQPCVETYTTSTVLFEDRWAHVVVSYDGADVTFYVDGGLVPHTEDSSVVALNRPIAFDLGAYAGAAPFLGRIDEVSLFDRALDQAEADARYRAGRWGRCATPNVLACHLGDSVDFATETRVNGQLAPGAPQKFARAGDVLEVTLRSPGGSYVGAVPALALDLLPAGTDLPSFPGIPGLHLGLTTQVVFNGLSQGPLGFTLLPSNGLTFAFAVPNGLEGQLVRFQSVAWFPTRVLSNAQDIEIRP